MDFKIKKSIFDCFQNFQKLYPTTQGEKLKMKQHEQVIEVM